MKFVMAALFLTATVVFGTFAAARPSEPQDPQTYPTLPACGSSPTQGWNVVLDESGNAIPMRQIPSDAPRPPAAWGSFDDAMNCTGWSILDIHTSEHYSGNDQSYAAGFLEGFLTSDKMTQQQKNMWGVDFPGQPGVDSQNLPYHPRKFTEENMKWMRRQVEENAEHDPYWQQVGFLLEQVRGLADGYNSARENHEKTPLLQILMMSTVDTDMDDLMTVVVDHGKLVNAHYRHYTGRRWAQSKKRRHHGHCSALVQVTPSKDNLFSGHVTWDEYRGMLRIMKYLDMPLPGANARRITFTSQPGSMYSGDDFYVANSGLTITETSIENYNQTAWALVEPNTVFTWVGVNVATRLATSGAEWTENIARYQNGLCNNQWMVVDYKKFTPHSELKDGTFWVAETMPGYVRREDMTQVLRTRGYWPSYNIPYFEDVWKIAGYADMQVKTPASASQYSWYGDVRGEMFARAARENWVTDLSSLMGFLRYNEIDDPLAGGDACNAISARCDLNSLSNTHYDCFGGIDAKVTAFREDLDDTSFYAVSGPTFGSNEKPFSWSNVVANVEGCAPWEHVGQPEVFNFSWYKMHSHATYSSPIWSHLEMDLAGQADAISRSRSVFVLLTMCSFVLTLSTIWLVRRRSARESENDHMYIRIVDGGVSAAG